MINKRIFLIVIFIISIVSCNTEEKEGYPIKEILIENNSNYIFKKIYVKDKLGRTHEILTSSSGNSMGGVDMLELCVYEEH